MLAELSVLIDDAPEYDSLLDQSASLIATRADGGCVIALLAADAERLHPLGLDHPNDAARHALERVLEGKLTPIPPLEQEVLDSGRGRRVDVGLALSVDRPGLEEFLGLTSRRHAVVVPLRAGGRSTGLLWAPTHGEGFDDDVGFFEFVASLLGLAVEHARLGEVTRPPAAHTSDSRLDSLTDRERQIVGRVAAGLTNREIAEELVLSQRTVEWHRSRIKMKLAVSGRSELTRLAREAGLGD